ncbi:cation:proton antiporter [Candidatus Woesearchaeota archaeon]|nr:cation:proton antiporter [Candidatus Woesearchaeota archaeon]
MDPLLAIIACLFVAALLAEVCARVGIPRVIGHISAGMVLGLGPIRSVVFSSDSVWLLQMLAQIGIILLLFFTGLEINLRLFVRNVALASNLSFWNTTLPLAGGFIVSRYVFGLEPSVSFIVGVCLSVTATALALDLLEEFKLLHTRFGNLVVAAGTVDDVYELLIITLALSYIQATSVTTQFATMAGNAAILALILLIAHHMLRRTSLWDIFQTRDSTLMVGILIPLAAAALSSSLGFGYLIGALLAGIFIRHLLLIDRHPARVWQEHRLSHNIHTIAFGFLVPLFFVQVGMLTDVPSLGSNLPFAITITIIGVAGTVIGCAIAHWLRDRQWRLGLLLGWALNSKGDTEIVIATLALQAGILTRDLFSSIIFMAVVSTLVSPIIFRRMLATTTLK